MQKKDVVTMMLGTVSGMLFALGMCMGLLPEWHAFNQGVVLGIIGLAGGLITWLIRRKMSGKQVFDLNLRAILFTLFAIVASLVLGIGLVMTMVWHMMIIGIVVGIVGIMLLLAMIPMVKGIAQ